MMYRCSVCHQYSMGTLWLIAPCDGSQLLRYRRSGYRSASGPGGLARRHLRRHPALTRVSCMDPDVELNRTASEAASEKHLREYQDLLQLARDQSSLIECELDLLRPLLWSSPAVVHLQSGHGLDDIAPVAAGAHSVTGVDFSEVAATAAQRRAEEPAVACRYVVAEVPGVPSAGLDVLHVAEDPEPFWRPQNVEAAAWRGQLPNSFTMLARHTRR
jgi:hypothetical protein